MKASAGQFSVALLIGGLILLAGAVAGLLVYALIFHFHADLFGVSLI